MEYESTTQPIVDWLKAKAKNSTVIWTSDHFSSESPFCGGWADIMVPEFQEAMKPVIKYGWVFTILSEYTELYEDEGSRFDWEFLHPHDLTVACTWSPAAHWYANEVPVRPDEELSEADAEALVSLAAEEEGAFVTSYTAWSIAAVNCALSEWAAAYAERPDIVFEWNPDGEMSDMMKEAIEAYEDVQSGKAQLKTFDLDEFLRQSGDDDV